MCHFLKFILILLLDFLYVGMLVKDERGMVGRGGGGVRGKGCWWYCLHLFVSCSFCVCVVFFVFFFFFLRCRNLEVIRRVWCDNETHLQINEIYYFYVLSFHQVRRVILAARSLGMRVRATGVGHSRSPMYVDEGNIMMDVRHLQRHDGPRMQFNGPVSIVL